MKKKDEFCSIISSYFAYFGADVAEMLGTLSDADARRVLHMFMNIVEEDYYRIENEIPVITIPVAKDIRKMVQLFLCFYLIDQNSAECINSAKEMFK